MNTNKHHIASEMNRRGKNGQPFAFLIDYPLQQIHFFDLNSSSGQILWQTPLHSNTQQTIIPSSNVEWQVQAISFERYKKAFELVQKHIHEGNSYLLNLTFPSEVKTNLSLEEIFHRSKAPYKIWLKDQFVCFSPEIFIRIENGTISSYPMKGTLEASLPNAEDILRNDPKESAEHHTIVDLIRNDMSLIADSVDVEKFCYIDRIQTHQGELLQMSSKITGQLPNDYPSHLGTILTQMLPAGSISGAPKKKTLEIIQEAEDYQRGYYTGIFGIFDGQNLDSCVLIRFLEKQNDRLIFKSGGGITFQSNCEQEYNELISKVYVPIT